MQFSRRQLLQSAGSAWTAIAGTPAGAYGWTRNTRTSIAQAYHPPIDPSLDYEPEKAVKIEVLAETIHRGHRSNLGPAIVRRTVGKGAVIYIGSSLEAVYEETA